MSQFFPKIPQSILVPDRRISVFWLFPFLAVLFAGWVVYRAIRERGTEITVLLDQGYGLTPGTEVRFRGMAVGVVKQLDLADDLHGVVVTAELSRQAESLARAGTRFWVVRPQVGVTGVVGLDTIVGPRYLALLPGEGPPQRQFVGLGDPPVVETIEEGDLEIILQSPGRGSLRVGAPILYRQVPIGVILSVGLTGDAGAVEARVLIYKAFTQLIRPETRFWSVGGMEAQVGIRGVTIQVESLESLLAGGVALATPATASDVVRTGHRFTLAESPEKEWLTWQPLAAIGSSFLPSGVPMPQPLRATAEWQQGRLLKSEKARQGWILQTDVGLLAPLNLVEPAGEEEEGVSLEVAGTTLTLRGRSKWSDGRIVLLGAYVGPHEWPMERRRRPTQPEDCLAVGDPSAAPLPLVATRLKPHEENGAIAGWIIDPAIAVGDAWHGAVVLSRRDGRLIGLIVVDEGGAKVALLPEQRDFWNGKSE